MKTIQIEISDTDNAALLKLIEGAAASKADFIAAVVSYFVHSASELDTIHVTNDAESIRSNRCVTKVNSEEDLQELIKERKMVKELLGSQCAKYNRLNIQIHRLKNKQQ